MKILYWTENEAAPNIMKHFNELGVDVPVFETEKNFLYLTNEDVPQDADLLIIPSTHRSATEKRSLTIHSTGNFGNADYGGEPQKLNPTNPAAVATGLRSMAKQASGVGGQVSGFEVCLEVTHHGPTLDIPLVFIEIGSSEKEWKDPKAGEIVANAMKDIIETLRGAKGLRFEGAKMENYIGFGGPHYAPSFTKVLLDNPNIAIGHILPNYHQDHITEDIVKQMLEKSNANKAVFDWKGLKSEPRKKAIEILEKISVEYYKTSDLH